MPGYQVCCFCPVDLDEPRGSHYIGCPFYISVNGNNQTGVGENSFSFDEAVELFKACFADGKDAANESPKSDNETYSYGWKKAREIPLPW